MHWFDLAPLYTTLMTLTASAIPLSPVASAASFPEGSPGDEPGLADGHARHSLIRIVAAAVKDPQNFSGTPGCGQPGGAYPRLGHPRADSPGAYPSSAADSDTDGPGAYPSAPPDGDSTPDAPAPDSAIAPRPEHTTLPLPDSAGVPEAMQPFNGQLRTFYKKWISREKELYGVRDYQQFYSRHCRMRFSDEIYTAHSSIQVPYEGYSHTVLYSAYAYRRMTRLLFAPHDRFVRSKWGSKRHAFRKILAWSCGCLALARSSTEAVPDFLRNLKYSLENAKEIGSFSKLTDIVRRGYPPRYLRAILAAYSDGCFIAQGRPTAGMPRPSASLFIEEAGLLNSSQYNRQFVYLLWLCHVTGLVVSRHTLGPVAADAAAGCERSMCCGAAVPGGLTEEAVRLLRDASVEIQRLPLGFRLCGGGLLTSAATKEDAPAALRGGSQYLAAESVPAIPFDRALSYLPSMPALGLLNLSYSGLDTAPDGLCHYLHLTRLCLRGNTLARLPESIGRLSRLTFLDASDNLLESLPESLLTLSALQYLNLSANRLTELSVSCEPASLQQPIRRPKSLLVLPASMCRLRDLKMIDLSDNRLETLPASIAGLSHQLEQLILTGNPIAARGLTDAYGSRQTLGRAELSAIFGSRVVFETRREVTPPMVQMRIERVYRMVEESPIHWGAASIRAIMAAPVGRHSPSRDGLLAIWNEALKKYTSSEHNPLAVGRDMIAYIEALYEPAYAGFRGCRMSPSSVEETKDLLAAIFSRLRWLLEKHGRKDVPAYYVPLLCEALLHRPERQFAIFNRIFSILHLGTDLAHVTDFLQHEIACLKSFLLNQAVAPLGGPDSRDVQDSWRRVLSTELGFIQPDSLPHGTDRETDNLTLYAGNTLHSFYSLFTPDYVIHYLLEELNSGSGTLAAVHDFLGRTLRCPKAFSSLFHYVDDATDMPSAITRAGVEELLVCLGILRRNGLAFLFAEPGYMSGWNIYTAPARRPLWSRLIPCVDSTEEEEASKPSDMPVAMRESVYSMQSDIHYQEAPTIQPSAPPAYSTELVG